MAMNEQECLLIFQNSSNRRDYMAVLGRTSIVGVPSVRQATNFDVLPAVLPEILYQHVIVQSEH